MKRGRWEVEIRFCDRWVFLAGYNSQDDAEWAASSWRQEHRVFGQQCIRSVFRPYPTRPFVSEEDDEDQVA